MTSPLGRRPLRDAGRRRRQRQRQRRRRLSCMAAPVRQRRRASVAAASAVPEPAAAAPPVFRRRRRYRNRSPAPTPSAIGVGDSRAASKVLRDAPTASIVSPYAVKAALVRFGVLWRGGEPPRLEPSCRTRICLSAFYGAGRRKWNPDERSSVREKSMLFASALTKQLFRLGRPRDSLASTMFVGGLSAKTTDVPPAETKAAETETAEPAKQETRRSPRPKRRSRPSRSAALSGAPTTTKRTRPPSAANGCC